MTQTSSHLVRLGTLLAAASLFACGGEGYQAPDASSTDDAGDTTESSDAGTDVTEDVEGDVTETYAYNEGLFHQCNTNDECAPVGGKPQECVSHVCVIPPTTVACLAEETVEDEVVVRYCEDTDSQILYPERSCYDPESPDYIFLEADGPETTALDGVVDRFGSGSATNGLCVGVYNEDLLLPYLMNIECSTYDPDDRGGEADQFIACFQLDTCRCEDYFQGQTANQVFLDAASEAWGQEIDSLDACYTFLGYCDGIEDTTAQTACVERVHSMTIDNMSPEVAADIVHQDTVIFSHTRSFQDPDPADPEAEDFGLYELTSVPTNTFLAFKVSGLERRWRDTWEYGLFVRADRVQDGSFTLDANAIADAGWRTIPPAVGLTSSIPDTHGAVAGAVRDCGDAERDPLNIVHATVGLSFDPAVLAYFNGNPSNTLPFPGRVDTNVLATYAGIDLPPGPNRVSPIILTDNDSFVSAGGRNVYQTPKSLIIATFEGNYAQE